MNVPSVDENWYVKSLWNRDIPYETLLTTFDSQNSKTKQPNARLFTSDSRNSKTKQPNHRLSKSNKQNSKAARPKVPPRQSGLRYNYEEVTTDLPPNATNWWSWTYYYRLDF